MNGLRVLTRLLRSCSISPLLNAVLLSWSAALSFLVSAVSLAKTLICCNEASARWAREGSGTTHRHVSSVGEVLHAIALHDHKAYKESDGDAKVPPDICESSW